MRKSYDQLMSIKELYRCEDNHAITVAWDTEQETIEILLEGERLVALYLRDVLEYLHFAIRFTFKRQLLAMTGQDPPLYKVYIPGYPVVEFGTAVQFEKLVKFLFQVNSHKALIKSEFGRYNF